MAPMSLRRRGRRAGPRILCVAAYRSNHADRHVSLLARAGLDVHLALLDGAWLGADGLDDGVHVHQRPIGTTSRPPGARGRSALLPDDIAARLIALADRALPSKGADDAASWLARLIDELRPDVLHSFSLHQASFLTLAARSRCSKPLPVWIVSNWGCDIHHFGRDPRLRDAYLPVITATLTSAQGYFAESRRDEALARAAGFAGKTLAIEPIGGGFDLSWFAALRGGEPPSRRSILMVKGYQGDEAGYMVGRALVAIEALHMASASLRQYEIHMYAARDPAVVASVEKLRDGRGIAVHIHPFLPYDALMRLHGRARCSIAISETDGICTSAIEAMLMGSVPIQSDTSCLAEWIAPDAALLVPHDDPEAIAAAVRRAVADDDYMDAAAQSNDVTLRARFAEEVVNPRIVRMYRDAVQLR